MLSASNSERKKLDLSSYKWYPLIVQMYKLFLCFAGTAGEPYLISTAEQMNEIGANPGDWNKHFMLIADVNMSDIAGTDYNIIEDFTGTFDGNDCTISNFSLNSTRQENTGLFGSVGGNINNLGLLRPNIFAQGRNVGSLIGFLNHAFRRCW